MRVFLTCAASASFGCGCSEQGNCVLTVVKMFAICADVDIDAAIDDCGFTQCQFISKPSCAYDIRLIIGAVDTNNLPTTNYIAKT